MNALLEESPALGLGSAPTHLGVTSASVTLVSTSCTLEANTSVTVRELSRSCVSFLLVALISLQPW